MADTVYDYFKQQLGRIPQDKTLRNLPNQSPHGLACCEIIDDAQAQMAFADDDDHADIVDAAEDNIHLKRQ